MVKEKEKLNTKLDSHLMPDLIYIPDELTFEIKKCKVIHRKYRQIFIKSYGVNQDQIGLSSRGWHGILFC